MARNFGGTNRTASHDSARSGDERHPSGRASTVVLIVRTVGPETDFRRRFGQRLESGTGSGTTGPGDAAAGRDTADGYGLEPGRADLFLHLAEHQSCIRSNGTEIH